MPDPMYNDPANGRCGEGDIVARLESIRREVDERFVAAGNMLIQAIDVSESLISSLETLSSVFNSRVVNVIAADLRVAAAKLCTLPACHAMHVDGVSRLNRSRESFVRDLSDMRCSLAYIQAFALKVAALTEKCGASKGDFERLAVGVEDMVSRGNDEIKALESDVAILQRELGAAADQGDVLGRKIGALLPDVPDDLSASTEIMREQYARIVTTAGSAEKLARDLHACVGRVLKALQIGDITRQRIEHVQACVIRMEADRKSALSGNDAAIPATGFALLAEQVHDIEAQFIREEEAITINIQEMATDAGSLLKLYHAAFAKEGGRGAGFLQRLAARVDAAIGLVEGIEAVDRATIMAGKTIACTAQRLARHVEIIRDLRSGIQDVAGAAAKYCELSDTRYLPLSNIAVEIRDHGKELEQAAAVGLCTLDKLIGLTANLTEAGLVIHVDEKSNSAAAREALAVAASRLREARDLTEVNVAEITAKSDAVQETLALSGERLALLGTIGTQLSAVARDVAALADGALVPNAEGQTASLLEMLDVIAGSYTMAQEREIHRRFVAKYGIDIDTPRLAAEDLEELF